MFRLKNKRAFVAFSCLILISCAEPNRGTEVSDIHSLLDSWHIAASEANEDAFFGSMTEDCIYLGTDKTEKWKRDELKSWSAAFFNRESAWSFTPFDREIYLNGDVAWFDEKLDTWMGTCRGSGVVVKKDGDWKLAHYNLAVLVPNEKIQGFIQLVGEK